MLVSDLGDRGLDLGDRDLDLGGCDHKCNKNCSWLAKEPLKTDSCLDAFVASETRSQKNESYGLE